MTRPPADVVRAHSGLPSTLRAHISGELVDAVTDLGFGIALIDPSGRVRDASDRCCDLVGMSLPELRARAHFSDVLVPAERDAVRARAARRGTDAPMPGRHDSVVLRPDGSEVPLEVAVRPLPVGAATWSVAVCRDVSLKVSIHRRLEQHAAVADELPLGVCVWKAVDAVADHMVLVELNRSASELLGVGSSDIGSTIRTVFGDAYVPEVARVFLDVALGTRQLESGTTVGAGDDSVWEWRAFPLQDSLVAVVFEDATERRSAERERLELLGRVISVGEAERQRLALELHDDPVQELAAVSMRLGGLRRRLAADDPHLETLLDVEAGVQRAMASLRGALFDLHPPELAFDDLGGAIAASVQRYFAGTSTSVTLDADIDDLRLDRERSVRLYRIVQEALANARRHAGAQRVEVRLAAADGRVAVTVADDGSGFDTCAPAGAGHLGVRSMVERAGLLGGTCQVTSTPGVGTTVSIDVPVDPPGV